jgi:hypothetical protein
MTTPGDPACLVATPASAASREDPADDRPEIGSWWWVTDEAAPGSDEDPDTEPDRYDRPGRQWLACVVEVGSNYAKLEGVRREERIALDEFHQRCVTEPAHRAVIDQKVDQHRGRVRELMRQISDLCHRLGVPTRQSLADAVADTPSQALAVAHGVADVQAYGQALARAKDETLPDLFKAVKDQHEQMATWMRAELIPASAELARAEGVTERIEGKIEMVELYAGLTEELVCVREGAPARLDDRVHLLQRRHYMDEECLARYEAGGMDFQDVAAFDQWLARDEHLHRLLPHPRCVLAFRVRRRDKDYGDTLEPFIKFWRDRENRKTYLYVRNGEQLWRLETAIDFGGSTSPATATRSSTRSGPSGPATARTADPTAPGTTTTSTAGRTRSTSGSRPRTSTTTTSCAASSGPPSSTTASRWLSRACSTARRACTRTRRGGSGPPRASPPASSWSTTSRARSPRDPRPTSRSTANS